MKPMFSIRSVGQQGAIEALAGWFLWRAEVQRMLRRGTRGLA